MWAGWVSRPPGAGRGWGRWLCISWVAVPDRVLSDRWQNMSRGFSESCVPFQGVTEPGERGRGPSGGSAGDLGIPFWGSLVGLEPVGPHASSSELECWTAVRCWRIGSWCGNAHTSVAWITSLRSCQARRRAGSTSAWVSTRSQTQNLSKRLNLEERNCASAGAGAGLLAVTSSPREGRKERGLVKDCQVCVLMMTLQGEEVSVQLVSGRR